MRIAAQKDQDMGRPRSASVSASQAGISISREQHREDMTEAEVLCVTRPGECYQSGGALTCLLLLRARGLKSDSIGFKS